MLLNHRDLPHELSSTRKLPMSNTTGLNLFARYRFNFESGLDHHAVSEICAL